MHLGGLLSTQEARVALGYRLVRSKGDFCLRMREKLFYFYPFVNALREARFSVLLNLTTEPLRENHCLIGPQ